MSAYARLSAFDRWLAEVNETMIEIAGVGVNDIADQPWYDLYTDEVYPEEAAEMALEAEGFPFA